MSISRFLIFLFFTLFFLFYPGDHPLLRYLFFYRSELDLLNRNKKKASFENLERLPYISYSSFPQITAESVIIVDLKTFTILYEKNSKKPLLPASTTKIVTALVAFDFFSLEKIITVGKPVNVGRVMGLVEGENISVENLLYGLIIHSANDAAYALAEEVGLENFVLKMNQKARIIGMKDSFFSDPAGLLENNQKVTAYDLVLASRVFLENKVLAKMASLKQITVSDNEYKNFHYLYNVNRLLGEIPGVAGLKTGFTENAGENLVTLFKKNNHKFIIVLLKSSDRFGETRVILDYLEDNLRFLSV